MKIISAVHYNQKLYFVSDAVTGLFEFDFESGRTIRLCDFAPYAPLDGPVCASILQKDNHIICAAGRGANFYDYDIRTNTVCKINLEGGLAAEDSLAEKIHYDYGCVIGDLVYFLGFNSLSIVEINPVSKTGKVYDFSDYEKIKTLKIDRLSQFGMAKATEILFPIMDTGYIAAFDTKTHELKLKNLNLDYKTLGLCASNKTDYIFSLQEVKVAAICGENRTKPIKADDSFVAKEKIRNICNLLNVGGKIILIPFRGNYLLELDEDSNCLKKLMNVSDLSGERTFISTGIFEDNRLWAYSEDKDTFMIYDVKNNARSDVKIPMPKDLSFIKAEDFSSKLMQEDGKGIDLERFINILAR